MRSIETSNSTRNVSDVVLPAAQSPKAPAQDPGSAERIGITLSMMR